MTSSNDRNFDDLAEHFSHKVYGGLKGEIRLAVLWRDLEQLIQSMPLQQQPLRILDIGAGLGQIAIRLATLGHHVVCNDLSAVMLDQARQSARQQGVEQNIEWLTGPYQDLINLSDQPFDLILCHALLEWLDQPSQAIPLMKKLLKPDGHLSLCFYNPAAKIYRNLICGNFNWLRQRHSYQSDRGSLTPNSPCHLNSVREWLAAADFTINTETGLRVFHDYVLEKRGGHQHPEEILAMELEYSNQEPFKWLGRYLHIIACTHSDA